MGRVGAARWQAIWRMGLWRTRRGRARIARHHLPLACAAAAMVAALAAWVDSPSLSYRLSIATAYVGLVLLSLTLAIGPLHVLWRGRPPPVSIDLRRDVGVVGALASLAHALIGLTVYADPRLYVLYPVAEWSRRVVPVRFDVFGWANYAGVAAVGLLLMLLAISGDWALRRYGAARWKELQQLAYWAFVLVVAHGMLYQRLEQRDHALVQAFGWIYGAVVVLQLAGSGRRAWRASRQSERPTG